MGPRSIRNSSTRAVAQTDTARGCVLAIDYGRRRIGLAISDAMGWTARPLETLARKGRTEELRRLREIVHAFGVKNIVVGHPLRMDGTASEMAEEAARYARRVEQALGLPVELVDERLTSWAAKEWLAKHPECGRRRGQDEIAAAILLEEYLSRKQGNG